MYRYLLFYYDNYYPHGGMEDCVLKTNNYDDLEQFIHTNYEDDYFQGTISYYDAVEDKTWRADMEDYENENYFTRWRFVRWEEFNND